MPAQTRLIIVLATAACLLLLVACQPRSDPAVAAGQSPIALTASSPAAVAPSPSAAANLLATATSGGPETSPAVASPTAAAPATPTPLPTSAPIQAPAATATETAIPSPTVNLTATVNALALADPVDRRCPLPPPGKPDYLHYYLSGERWPTPDTAPEEHFWLIKPLPGGGRWLYTDWLPYGYDANGRYLLHNGIDSAQPLGTPVLAAADGTVVVAGDDARSLYGWRCDWYGHLVVIELDQKWRGQPVFLLYGHVLEIKVRPGEHVSQGQQVAEVGVGGAADVPHLHFEVRLGSNEFNASHNPLLWVAPAASRGIIAGRLVDPEGRPWQGVAVSVVARLESDETRTTWTYLGDPLHIINPDESLAENFVIADLEPGEYELHVELQGEMYTVPVVVLGGQMTVVEIVTAPLKAMEPGAAGETNVRAP